MGIKSYYNKVRKSSHNKAAATKSYEKYWKEIDELVDSSTRLLYVGDLNTPGMISLVEKFIFENCLNDSRTVLLIEGKKTTVVDDFLETLPERIAVIKMPTNDGESLMQSFWLYQYSNNGKKNAGLDSFYKTLADRYFNKLNCDTIEFLTTDKIAIIEALVRSNKETVWHKVPINFFSRLSNVMYKHPEIVKGWETKFCNVVRYNDDYANEIWKTHRCYGAYAKLTDIRLSSNASDTRMTAKLEWHIQDKNAKLQNNLVIGSHIYDNEFNYEMTVQSQDGSSCRVSVNFPNKEMAAWFNSNMLFVVIESSGVFIKVPVQANKKEKLSGKIHSIVGTGRVCEIKTAYRHYRFIIRDKLVTDDSNQKFKLAVAFIAHLLTPWNKPILLYEKKCLGYEESASVLFEKLVDRGMKNARFVLNENSIDASDIDAKYRKQIVKQFSFGHYYALFACRCILSSEALGHALEKGTTSWLFNNMILEGHKDYVFLQHGVMYMVSLSSEQRQFFNKRNGRGKQKVVVSSMLEAEHFTDNTDYKLDDLYVTGLPKFDKSVLNSTADRISIMLTWRPWDSVVGLTDIRQTGYYKMLRDIVKNIPEDLKEKLIVMPHPLILNQVEANPNDEVWKYFVPGLKYEDMLKQTKVLITDYSSISYDAFYRGSNVIFCWAEKDYCMRNYGKNAHLMLTEDLAFGPVCYSNADVSDAVRASYNSDQTEEYNLRYSKLVEFRDGTNTERLIEKLISDKIICGTTKNSLLGRIKKKLSRMKADKLRNAYVDMLNEPLRNNAILFEARNGKEVDGNVYYLLKEILTNPDYDEFEIFFSVESDKVKSQFMTKLCKCNTERITTVRVDSKEYYHAFATCKYIINDATIKNFFVKRDGQVYLNTWHGTPFKYMGKKVAHEPHAVGNAQKNFVVADYLLYPNEYTMNHFVEDYMIHDISKATILLGGYPRNSAFFDDSRKAEIVENLQLSDKRIYVYMPTWRPEVMGYSTESVLARFDELLKDDEVMYAKIHPLAADKIDFSGYKNIKKYPSDYETYEFLNVADCLITDYSSVFYDYAITGKKIVLYTYDEEEYFRTRGVYEPLESLPFTKVKSEHEAIEAARTAKDYDDESFLKKYCCRDSARAAEVLCKRFIREECSSLIDEREMPSNGLPIIMVDGGSLAPGEHTDKVMSYLEQANTEKANYYLFFKRAAIKNNWKILFKLPTGINYYGIPGKTYNNKTVEHKRAYGNIEIDSIIEI